MAKAPDGEAMAAFKALLDGGFGELELHHSYAARWGVDLVPEPAPATSAYTDFQLRVAAREPVGHGWKPMPTRRGRSPRGNVTTPELTRNRDRATPDSPGRQAEVLSRLTCWRGARGLTVRSRISYPQT